MMNGPKPCGPSDGFQAPNPTRTRPKLRVFVSRSPHPSPRGEGETFTRALLIRPSVVVVCLRNERPRGWDTNRKGPNFPAPCQCSPSPWGEGWGEEQRTKLQPSVRDYSRNLSNFASPRQSRGFPDLIMRPVRQA